jgi:hypothetical protein
LPAAVSGQVLPPHIDWQRWSLIWPSRGEISFPPAVPVSGAEVTKRIADQSDWMPFSDVARIWHTPR